MLTFMIYKRKFLRAGLLLSIVFANIGCDQFSKKVVRNNIHPTETIQLFNNHLVLMNVENTGAFLSLGDSLSAPYRTFLLTFLPLLALLSALIYLLMFQQSTILFSIGLSFIVGGGIGNLIDRTLHGSVTDFLFIHSSIFRTGIFNLADAAIMLGSALMIVPALFSTAKSKFT